GYRQGRVASRRTLSPRRLHRDEHEPPARARRCFLQQARDVRAKDQGGQRRDQVDATVVPNVRRQCGAASASCARAYNLGNFLRTLARPEPIKDWSLTTLKDKLIKIGAKVVSHGRYVIFQMAEVAIPRQMFQEFCGSSRNCGRSHHQRQRETFDVMHSRATDRRSASKCQGKWPDQTLDQAFGLPEVLVAVSTSRLSCKRAGKTRTLRPV